MNGENLNCIIDQTLLMIYTNWMGKFPKQLCGEDPKTIMSQEISGIS